MKVIQRSKAKVEAFRDKRSPKVENESFLLHLNPNFLDRDENCFSFPNAEPCVNQCFH